MNDYGDLDFESAWQDTPLAKYIDHKKNRDNITNHRLSQVRHAIVRSSERSDYESWNQHINWQDEMTTKDAWDFLDQLRASGLAETTVREYMHIVQSFLHELYKRGVVDANPIAYVCDEADFDIQTEEKIERTVSEVSDYLKSIRDPQFRAIGVIFAKTGIRVGEMVNIDLTDVNLDHSAYQSFMAKNNIDIHPMIEDRPDSLYIPSMPTMGRKYRGEKRKSGNKRKRDTVLPVDEETKRTLLDWVAVRPRTEHPHPLWIGEQDYNRIRHALVSRKLTDHYAEKTGFINDGSDETFSSHWFRHFFTTQLTPGYGDHDDWLNQTMIKYLRGDVYSIGSESRRNSDIMEVYLHDWGDTIRPEYEKAVYQFGIYD